LEALIEKRGCNKIKLQRTLGVNLKRPEIKYVSVFDIEREYDYGLNGTSSLYSLRIIGAM
jgi:hypothetical protein